MTRALPVAVVAIAFTALMAASSFFGGCFVEGIGYGGAVGDRCFTASDCAAGLVCGSDGRCAESECVSDADCGPGELCHSHVCKAVDRPAPAFALIDRNPGSPRFGETISAADYRGDVLLVYFANAS